MRSGGGVPGAVFSPALGAGGGGAAAAYGGNASRVHAATLYHQLDGRPPEAALFPLITARDGTELAACAEAVRLLLPR
jgi:hypothetical protein